MHLQDVRVEILISLVVFEDNNCFIYLLSRNLGGFVVVLLVCVFLFGCINSSSIQVQIKKKKDIGRLVTNIHTSLTLKDSF